MDERNFRKYDIGAYDGNAARNTLPLERPERNTETFIRTRTTERTKRKPQVRVSHGMDLFSLIVLVCAIAATFIICVRYLQIQSDIVNLKKDVSGMESMVSQQVQENNAMEDMLNATAPDLDQVYLTAVGVLGMVYPNNNTVYY